MTPQLLESLLSRASNPNRSLESIGAATQEQKPNILFIMGDDIGWIQPSIYHRGLAVGETPNIDRIGNEGAIFMTYYAEQSCTAGRTAFITGHAAGARRHGSSGNSRKPVLPADGLHAYTRQVPI